MFDKCFLFTLAKVHTHYGLAKGFSLNAGGKIPIVDFLPFAPAGFHPLQ